MKKLRTSSRVVVALAALAIIIVYFVPLWRILMWAPQYPEWLQMKIWVNNITGDVNTINGLNHYIGMKLIKKEMFPEFEYIPLAVGFIILYGVLVSLINRRWALLSFIMLLIAAAVGALVDFYLWGYDYGHNLDPHAAIQVPGMAYQPPLIGTKQLLNFTAFSGPDIGGWVLVVVTLTVVAIWIAEVFFYNKKQTA